jgi:lysophospholipase L1-like esterase
MIDFQVNRLAWAILLLRLAAATCAVEMGGLVGIPWIGLGALGLLGVVSAVVQTPRMVQRRRFCIGGLTLAVFCSLLAAFGLWTVSGTLLSSNYYSILAWLVAVTLLPPARTLGGGWLQPAWKGLGLVWAFWGGFVWLAGSYIHNLPAQFYASLAINLLLCFLCRASLRLPFLAVQVINTLILLLIVVPAVDLALRAIPHPTRRPQPSEELYLYRNAQKDPAGYAQWCATFDAEWFKVLSEIFVPDPAGRLRPRPRPNSQAQLFDSHISINSLGFRGKEVPRDKANAYRIVTLGESTTFGFTLRQNDPPWPELLELMIRERLHPKRSVEVINAGMPGWDLRANLGLLTKEILPLQPDLIISYHGYNGFEMIHRVVPLSNLLDPPVYRPRPVKLLADCEYRWAVRKAVRREQALLATRASSFVSPVQTEYARAYERLIQFAETNHIRLVLADYSMAVNDKSPTALLDFYRSRYPALAWWVKANQVHSVILRQLVQQHPEVLFVNTHPNLDGDSEKFIDIMHFTPAGRRQMAETMYAGIRALLEHDLAAPAQANDRAAIRTR